MPFPEVLGGRASSRPYQEDKDTEQAERGWGQRDTLHNSHSLSLVISAAMGAQAEAGTTWPLGRRVNMVPPAASRGLWPEPRHCLGMLDLAVGRWDREGLPLSNSQTASGLLPGFKDMHEELRAVLSLQRGLGQVQPPSPGPTLLQQLRTGSRCVYWAGAPQCMTALHWFTS